MSMEINTTHLAMFRDVKLEGENAIANVGTDGKSVVQNKKLGSLISRLFRSKTEESLNNAARTALLKSLGQAFGLSGMTESGGTTKFSADFMKKLEGILGRDVLKTGDFKISSDGTVSSGKPLTKRRIDAIINKAVLVSPGAYNYADYKAKLDYVRTRLDAMPATMDKSDVEGAKKKFNLAEKMMDFVKDEIPGLVVANDPDDIFDYDPTIDAPLMFKMRTEGGGTRNAALNSFSAINSYVGERIGAPFHLQENILGGKFNTRLSDVKDPKKQIPEYFKNVMTAYATTIIDLFIECEKLGKLDKFVKALNDYAICTEAKTSALIEFRLNEIPSEDGPVVTHNSDQPLDQCIGREIAAMVEKNPDLMESDDFKDFAEEIKKNLVGTIRPITVPQHTAGGIKFVPLMDGNNKPVVRAITEEDIDRLGQACIDATNGL